MSPAYGAHPEFGYLWPSRRLRRTMWTALALTALGALAGAVVLGGDHDNRGGPTALSAPVDAAPSRIEAMPAVEPAPAPATAARPRPPAGGRAACEGATWTYLDGKCNASGARRVRTAASDKPPIAAVPLGRTALPPPAAAPAPATSDRVVEAAALPSAKSGRVVEPASALPDLRRVGDAPATASDAAAPSGQSTATPKGRREASRGRYGGRDLVAEHGSRRHARAGVPPGRHDRQSSMQKSAMRWARQLSECFAASRCAAGEQVLRTMFPPVM